MRPIQAIQCKNCLHVLTDPALVGSCPDCGVRAWRAVAPHLDVDEPWDYERAPDGWRIVDESGLEVAFLRDEQHAREDDARRIASTRGASRLTGELVISAPAGVSVLAAIAYAVVCAALGFVIGELAR